MVIYAQLGRVKSSLTPGGPVRGSNPGSRIHRRSCGTHSFSIFWNMSDWEHVQLTGIGPQVVTLRLIVTRASLILIGVTGVSRIPFFGGSIRTGQPQPGSLVVVKNHRYFPHEAIFNSLVINWGRLRAAKLSMGYFTMLFPFAGRIILE
jgi:hypothetical protein